MYRFYWSSRITSPNQPAGGGSSSFHQAQMAKKKFRGQMAKVGEQKSMFAFIDSVATHKFFHAKQIFRIFKIIEPEMAQAAHGETILIVKGTVLLPLETKIIPKAYHATGFSSHMLTERLLSDNFEVIFSSSISGHKGYFLFRNGSFSKEDI